MKRLLKKMVLFTAMLIGIAAIASGGLLVIGGHFHDGVTGFVAGGVTFAMGVRGWRLLKKSEQRWIGGDSMGASG